MPYLCMRHDFRAPAFGPASTREIYTAALEQYAWADRNGFDLLVLSEHHGIDDGWMPAPLTMAGVVLGRTTQARVMVSAAILPLHDPVRVAEQIAVLDNAAPGRLWIVVRRRLPHRGVRDGRTRTCRTRPSPRGVRRSPAASLGG